MTSPLREYLKLCFELDALDDKGLGDSCVADLVRDKMDVFWVKMDRDTIGLLYKVLAKIEDEERVAS